MTGSPALPPLLPDCPPVERPKALLDPATTVAGLRAAQSRMTGTRFLDVWLFQDPPAALADPARWEITGPPGTSRVSVTAAAIVTAPTPHVELTLAGEPDMARYRVAVHADDPPAIAFDPLRTWLLCRLRPECPDLGACFEDATVSPARLPSPVQDYLARDWRSLRRALLEYLRIQDPDTDLSVADPTVTVAELFAHAGDLLHYRLDRVATEAYLETARLRTSVRRHARLVDFPVRDGASARTFVHLSVAPEDPPVAAVAGDVAVDLAGSALAFALEQGITAHDGLGEIAVHDWGEDACCLPEGATECVLVRPQPADPLGPAWLVPGDRLVFEVVDPLDAAAHRRWAQRDPGQPWPPSDPLLPPGAPPAFRVPLSSRAAHVVRVVDVTPIADPLGPPTLELVNVRWAPEDALPRPYAVGIDAGAGAPEVTVARGNVVPAHHGRLVYGDTTAARDTATWWLTAAGTPVLGGPGLAFDAGSRPHTLDVAVTLPSTATVTADVLPTLLESRAGDLAVVVETEAHEPPVIRFRTGAVGTAPPDGSSVTARYEVGGGSIGNVPANALSLLEHDINAGTVLGYPAYRPVAGVVARNPVPAGGGREPDLLDGVRRDAPEAFAAVPRRAVVAADHAAAARDVPGVARAFARRTFAGSWPLVTAVVDADRADPSPILAAVQSHLDGLRMLGTEVAAAIGRPAALFVALEVCAARGFDAEDVRRRALAVLRPGDDERPGVFHPSRLQLGGAVYLSAVIAAVGALAGVDAVEVREARRLGEPAGTLHQVITFGPDEIPLLDDDPGRPDRGRLDVHVRGGR